MLELRPLYDFAALDAMYRDPYIARVGHDHRPATPVIHPEAIYLGAYLDNYMFGAFLIIESGFIECDVHALLKREALPYSRQFGGLCLDYVFSRPHVQRVTAYVIEGLEQAKNYCIKLGFVHEGMRRDACVRNGKLIGVHTLGMTRQDWENQ